MPYETDRLKDYIQVNERILKFYEKYPEGSLQSEIISLESDRVVMKAYAYRTPDDGRPGIGYSSLQIPGPTPYTKHSEIENAETSAWGRALAALGFEVKRGVASRDEIENKSDGDPFAETTQKPSPTRIAETDPILELSHLKNDLASAAQRKAFWAMVLRVKPDKDKAIIWMDNRLAELGLANPRNLTVGHIKQLTTLLTEPADESQSYEGDDMGFETDAERAAREAQANG